MSVINQMLKDLDKRQGEQNIETSTTLPATTKNSNVKFTLSIILVIVLINIAGIYAWQLYSENQQLKIQAKHNQNIKLESNFTDQSFKQDEVIADKPGQALAVKSTVEKVEKVEKSIDKSQQIIAANSAKTATVINTQNSEKIKISKQKPSSEQENTAAAYVEIEKDTSNNHLPALENIESRNVSATKLKNEETLEVSVTKPKPRLSISRTQLSPQALAEKKITEAEQSMEVNELGKAESLFEEVLLLLPNHETARKQLAALWYGKKAYQDAINLLSQGIALAPRAEEMRLMSARIYFEQGQAQRALDILNPVNNSQSIELQALLANVAAQLNDHKSASSAYQKLLTLEPSVGRWWLGLAVSLDSQGQFKQASNAYSQAIATGNLSSNTMQFARQRLSELGE